MSKDIEPVICEIKTRPYRGPIFVGTVKAGSTVAPLPGGKLLVTHPDEPPYILELMWRPGEHCPTVTLELEYEEQRIGDQRAVDAPK